MNSPKVKNLKLKWYVLITLLHYWENSNVYDKSHKLIDRREMLRVKIKSLAEEARIIRREEKRTHGVLREQLYMHRIGIVRSEARAALLAYGLIRGKTLEQMEPTRKPESNWRFKRRMEKVKRLCEKYGPADSVYPDIEKAA